MKHLFRLLLTAVLAGACWVIGDNLVNKAGEGIVWDGKGLWPFIAEGVETQLDEIWKIHFRFLVACALGVGFFLYLLWYVTSRWGVNHTRWPSAGARIWWWFYFLISIILFFLLFEITPVSSNIQRSVFWAYFLALPGFFYLSTFLFSGGGGKYAPVLSVYFRRYLPWI
jgi:hypothetical protein